VSGDRENGTRLGKMMGAWEPASECQPAKSAELTRCVPPSGKVHFAKAGYRRAQLHQPGRIEFACLSAQLSLPFFTNHARPTDGVR
jgi:hypothetical protein